MSFESFIKNFGIIDFRRFTDSAHSLAAYFGEDSNERFFQYKCVIGRIFENENKEVCCSIEDKVKVVPEEYLDELAACVNGLGNWRGQIGYLEKLWKCLNKKCVEGIFLPVCLRNHSVMFLYCEFAREHFYKKGVLIDYSELIDNYPVLNSTIETEVICERNGLSSVHNSTMPQTVITIDRFLNNCGFPNIQLIHSLANVKYENQNNEGVICFVNDEKDIRLKFQNPQPLVYSEIRAIRKYFQMVGNKLNLIAVPYNAKWADPTIDKDVDVWMIQGIGECSNAIATLYYSSGKKWKLVKGEEEVGYDGSCFFARRKFNKEHLKLNELSFMCSQEEIKRFIRIVKRLMKQNHGTMLVISSVAREEASRLGHLRRAMETYDYDLNVLTDREMLMISAIDGCILSDAHGNCTALGAILDGEANIATDIGRGARYNSALTYIKKMNELKHKAAAIVISEDGTIDIVNTETIHQKEIHLDRIKEIESTAYYDIQDASFGNRFANLTDEDE